MSEIDKLGVSASKQLRIRCTRVNTDSPDEDLAIAGIFLENAFSFNGATVFPAVSRPAQCSH